MYDPEASQIHYPDIVGSLGNDNLSDTVSQSFKTNHHNLNSITVWLTGDGLMVDPKPYLHFTLYQNPDKTTVLYRASFQLPSADFQGPFRISFPKIITNPDQLLLFELGSSNGTINVNGIREDIYPRGTAFVHENPESADLTFSTTYIFDKKELILDLQALFLHLFLVFPIMLVLIIPGWFIIQALGINDRLDFWGMTALSGGLSLAILPLILFWSGKIGIQWSVVTTLLFNGILLFLSLWLWSNNKIRKWDFKPNISKTDLLLTALVVFSAIIRFFMIRDYAGPLGTEALS